MGGGGSGSGSGGSSSGGVGHGKEYVIYYGRRTSRGGHVMDTEELHKLNTIHMGPHAENLGLEERPAVEFPQIQVTNIKWALWGEEKVLKEKKRNFFS